MPLKAHLYSDSKARTAFAVLERLSFIKCAYIMEEIEDSCLNMNTFIKLPKTMVIFKILLMKSSLKKKVSSMVLAVENVRVEVINQSVKMTA